MERFLTNVSLLVFLIFFYQRIRHGLHILQLENYYNDRYIVWMKRYISKVLDIKVIIGLAISILLFFMNQVLWGLILQIIIYGLCIATTKKTKEKKAFVVTARIRRMYLTYMICFVVIGISANIGNVKIVWSMVNILGMLAYGSVYLINVINKPIETLIRKKFCQKAMNKLKEIPNLKVIGITGSYGNIIL